jgi:hypothetical protein
VSAADDIAALERELAVVDARREPILGRLRQARADAAAAKPPVVSFDPTNAPFSDPRFASRWPGWQKFGANVGSVLEVVDDAGIIYSPAAIPLEEAKRIDASSFRPTPPEGPRAIGRRGERICLSAHLVHDAVASGRVKIAQDQTKPPSPIRWHDAVPWRRPSVPIEAHQLELRKPLERPR